MTHTQVKKNKKDEQKKLMVRIVCMALVVALLVTSLLTMIPGLFQQEQSYDIQTLIDAGLVYQGEDGNYYFTDAYLEEITAEDDHDHE